MTTIITDHQTQTLKTIHVEGSTVVINNAIWHTYDSPQEAHKALKRIKKSTHYWVKED